MIQAKIHIALAPEKEDEVWEILQSLVERTRAETGCRGCAIFRDTERAHTLVFEELWHTEADLQRHLRSEEYRQVLLALEMGVEPPVIRFDTVTSTQDVGEGERDRVPKEDEPS